MLEVSSVRMICCEMLVGEWSHKVCGLTVLQVIILIDIYIAL